MSRTPNRLLNETFFSDTLQIRLIHAFLTEPYALHWHEFYELTFIVSGQGVNTVNGISYALKPGDLFLLTPADFHTISPEAGTTLELYNLIFSQHMLSDDMVKLLFSQEIGRYAHFHKKELYEGILFRFKSLVYEKDVLASGRDIAVQSELHRLLIEWHRHRCIYTAKEDTWEVSAKPSLIPHYHPGIHKSLIYIQHHFRQPIPLEKAAQQAHLSTNYFSELFSKTTGVSFQHYLQQLRLQFAHALLRTSSLSVTEISYISGFNTLTHFERVFRLNYGTTPREAQKQRT
ncbi:HTH-type transcriptional activator RhaS [compost metagenome]